jgi:hypothetical protein
MVISCPRAEALRQLADKMLLEASSGQQDRDRDCRTGRAWGKISVKSMDGLTESDPGCSLQPSPVEGSTMKTEEVFAHRSALVRATSPAAELARAEYVVGLLRTSVGSKPWIVHEDDAARFLRYFRDRAAGKRDSARNFHTDVVWFCNYYNQSLDWILYGDAATMIYEAAARSLRAAEVAAPKRKRAGA